jgi:hypothetical protein
MPFRPLVAALVGLVALLSVPGLASPRVQPGAAPGQATGVVPTPRLHCGTPTPGLTPTSPAFFPDLVVRGMALGPRPCQACGQPGEPIGIVVEVGNAGIAESPPFLVEVNGSRQAVAGLEPRKYVNVWFPGYRSGENVAIVDPLDQVYEAGAESDNALRGVLPTQTWPLVPTCTPDPGPTPLRPDLAVSRMHIGLSPGWSCGQPARLGIHVSVTNRGEAASGPFVVEANATPRAMGPLAAQGSGQVWIAGYRRYSEEEAAVDTGGQVAESDETNNERRERLPVPTLPACPTATPTPGPALPDLVIVSARWQMAGFDGRCVPEYGPPELLVDVRNLGAADAGAFTVRTDPPRASWRVEALFAGDRTDLRAIIPGGADYVEVDADREVAEGDEANNRVFAPNPTWTPPPLCTTQAPTPSLTPTAPTPLASHTPSATLTATASPTATPRPAYLPLAQVSRRPPAR